MQTEEQMTLTQAKQLFAAADSFEQSGVSGDAVFRDEATRRFGKADMMTLMMLAREVYKTLARIYMAEQKKFSSNKWIAFNNTTDQLRSEDGNGWVLASIVYDSISYGWHWHWMCCGRDGYSKDLDAARQAVEIVLLEVGNVESGS